MSKKFDSVIASPMGAFVRSPLGVRESGGVTRAVYVSCAGDVSAARDDKIFRLSLDDLSNPIAEGRPPWWPAPHPQFGQEWSTLTISGDSGTVWYSAVNLADFYGDPGRWTIDIYKLRSDFTIIDSWRWSPRPFGNGHLAHVQVFGTSEILWALGYIQFEALRASRVTQMYLFELDPVTMDIRRSSGDLWEGVEETSLRRFNAGGGGTPSVIRLNHQRLYLTPVGQENFIRRTIQTYSPDDFHFVGEVDAPRTRLEGDDARFLSYVGGDDTSIWITLSSAAFGRVPGELGSFNRISELPADYSDENLTIIQDEIIAPWPLPGAIG